MTMDMFHQSDLGFYTDYQTELIPEHSLTSTQGVFTLHVFLVEDLHLVIHAPDRHPRMQLSDYPSYLNGTLNAMNGLRLLV